MATDQTNILKVV